MRIAPPFFAPALALFVGLGLSWAGGAAQDEKKLPPPPWHLVDVWWDLGRETPFESYSIDVTLSDDVTPAVNLYVAPIGIGYLNKIQFYGGLQTQADGNTRSEPRLRKIGRGLLFSMWGERSLDAIRPSDGGLLQSSGHEGDFVSVRRPYDWKKGKYTYRLVRMDREEVEGKPCTWVGAFVYSHARDENVYVGALRFKSENLVLGRQLASFVEIYGRRIPMADIPRVTVTFENLRVNGRPVDRPGATAVYPKSVPDYAEATGRDGAVVVEVGQAIADRKERRVELLKK
jgi:Domain of unknown function (DUF3472)